jgi:hypothetical protein
MNESHKAACYMLPPTYQLISFTSTTEDARYLFIDSLYGSTSWSARHCDGLTTISEMRPQDIRELA